MSAPSQSPRDRERPRGVKSETAGKYAQIVTLDEFAVIREQRAAELGTVVCTCGGFDPIHAGHTSCIVESTRYGDTLVVVVNGDAFLRAKKGKPFQDLATRCQVIASLRGVDYVIPFEIEGDPTTREALRRVRPHVFTKGGDRTDAHSIPEWDVCTQLGIKVITGVGLEKRWSSSDFLREWGEFWLRRAREQGNAGG